VRVSLALCAIVTLQHPNSAHLHHVAPCSVMIAPRTNAWKGWGVGQAPNF